MTTQVGSFSIVLPAKNEAANLNKLLPQIKQALPHSNYEIIVVNDGSDDETCVILDDHDVDVVSHPYSLGNGAAIKTGARTAKGDILVFMDADGQHNPDDIPRLLAKIDEGYDMVVGARQADTHASLGRRIANNFYNRLASMMTGYKIEDLTSGFRAVSANKFRKFLYLLPNGFSYPTTSTMAFFRSGFPVAYIPIQAKQREGRSHIKLLKDGLRFFIIILKIGALFSPMRLFLPVSAGLFCIGLTYYSYTFMTAGRFTNMSALLFIFSLFTFLIGILAEQVSSLHYKGVEDSHQTQFKSSSENN